MATLTYSEGPGATLGHASTRAVVEGEGNILVVNAVSRLNADWVPRQNR